MHPFPPIASSRWPGLLGLALLIAFGASARAQGPAPILATPPRQAEPWTPQASGLPRFLGRATATLCAQGLADPRGCEYRKVRIVVGSVWGGEGHELGARGWILPPPDGGRPRHAVAWSGLVYPIVGDDGPADLDADVRSLVEAAKANARDVANPSRGFHSYGDNNEPSSVNAGSLHPIKVCLLLRLGRADLAEQVWDAALGSRKTAGGAGGPGLDLNSYGISYLTLATDLAWYHFDRAICAHMRGDDPVALADTRFLMKFDGAVEVQAERMGFERPDRIGREDGPAPYIDFLGQLPEFLADHERRAAERAKPTAQPPPGRSGRVASLIRDLDQVAARQWGQPGGVVLGESPIIKQLIELGDVAVGPLIRDFRTDDRLTRSVGFHRDFFRNRTILPADQAAYTALTGILKSTNFAPTDANRDGKPRHRDDVADEIQAYWEKVRDVPMAERWYRALLDDGAGAEAWLEAAGQIIQPENVRTVPGGGPFQVTETTALAAGRKPMLRGEPLRDGREPSVAALMARRVESISRAPRGQDFELLRPCRMAQILAEWDPVAGSPTLRDMTRICRERYAQPSNGRDWTNQNLASSIASFTLARDRAGDRDAIREYAEWVRTTRPEWLGQNAAAVLEPFVQKPEDLTLATVADWLFNDPNSSWAPIVGRKESRTDFHIVELIASPMVRVPAFRRMLLKALEDRRAIGTADAGEGGAVSIRVDDGFSMGRTLPKIADDAPPPGTSSPLRLCDLYAWELATLEEAPAFHPCWPEARRDAVLAAMADFLRRKDSSR